MVEGAKVNLALTTALLSVVLIICSQVQRRLKTPNPWLDMLIRFLAVLVVILVITYFYNRFFA